MSEQSETEELYTLVGIQPADIPEDFREFIEKADLKTLLNFIATSDIPESLKQTLYLRDEEGIKDALFGIIAMGQALDRLANNLNQEEEI